MLVEIEVAPKPAVAIADIYGHDTADVESDAARQRGCETVVVMAGIDIDEAVTDTTADIGLDHRIERKVDIGIRRRGAEIEIIVMPEMIIVAIVEAEIGAEHRVPFIADAAADDLQAGIAPEIEARCGIGLGRRRRTIGVGCRRRSGRCDEPCRRNRNSSALLHLVPPCSDPAERESPGIGLTRSR